MTDKQEQSGRTDWPIPRKGGHIVLITVYTLLKNSHLDGFGADQSTMHRADLTMNPDIKLLCIVLGSVGAAKPLQRAGCTSGSPCGIKTS